MGEKAPRLDAWIPSFAREAPAVPEWVKRDMQTGVRLRVARQGLFDAMRDLDGET